MYWLSAKIFADPAPSDDAVLKKADDFFFMSSDTLISKMD